MEANLNAAGGNLGAFLEEVRQGPAASRVDDIESNDLQPAPELEGFEIRF